MSIRHRRATKFSREEFPSHFTGVRSEERSQSEFMLCEKRPKHHHGRSWFINKTCWFPRQDDIQYSRDLISKRPHRNQLHAQVRHKYLTYRKTAPANLFKTHCYPFDSSIRQVGNFRRIGTGRRRTSWQWLLSWKWNGKHIQVASRKVDLNQAQWYAKIVRCKHRKRIYILQTWRSVSSMGTINICK